MKTKFLYLFLLLPYLVRGNMSSPIQQGTMSSAPFSSKDITIVSEKIFVTIAPDGKTARFSIEYNIKSDIEGQQIPLLFYARDFKDSFTVKLDDKSIKLQDTPTKYLEKNMFDGFLSLENQDEEVTIYWGTNVMENTTCRLQELKYFETNIEKGVHKITVTYTAEAWIDRLGWLKKYDFRYSLSPAKYWKSFGTLEINIKQQGEQKQLTTNLGTPTESNNNSQTWLFDKLPAEYFTISYAPSPSKLAAILINNLSFVVFEG